MHFEISERFTSISDETRIRNFLWNSFSKISSNITDTSPSFTVMQVNPTFGSINRKDETIISVSKREGDILLVASVNYKPSVAFWIIFIISLFSTIGWLIPLVFYFYQKKTVREAIQEVFSRTKNEFHGSNSPVTTTENFTTQLEKLVALKEKGGLTQEEFQAQKEKLIQDHQENPREEKIQQQNPEASVRQAPAKGNGFRKFLGIVGGAVAILLLFSLCTGEDPVNQMLDEMETTVIAMEKLIKQLEQGKISAIEFELRGEELALDIMEIVEKIEYIDDSDLSPKQQEQFIELVLRLEAAGNNTAVRMLQYYY